MPENSVQTTTKKKLISFTQKSIEPNKVKIIWMEHYIYDDTYVFFRIWCWTSAMWYAKNELNIKIAYAKKNTTENWNGGILLCYVIWKFSEKKNLIQCTVNKKALKTQVVRPNTYSSLSCIVFFSVVIINDNIAFGLKLSLVVLPPLGAKQWKKNCSLVLT